MQDGFYPYKKSSIHFARWGTGPTLLICFHGYGESASSFTFLGNALANRFTLLAIDLPFHGSTVWNEGTEFQPEDLLSILEKGVENLPAAGNGWWLLGYSMGGRIALSLLEKVPEMVDRLILIAPDGLTVNPWYWLATQTSLGNKLFRWTMRHPGWLFLMLRTGNALKWVNPGVFKFTMHYIADEQVRKDLYTRWTTMRGFRPHLPAIRNCIRARATPVRLLYGRHDRVIRWENGERFRKGIGTWCRLMLLSAGHQLLQPAHLDAIMAAITDPQ
jgi:pimeloyl-ACP methyl ester carboxylesterase